MSSSVENSDRDSEQSDHRSYARAWSSRATSATKEAGMRCARATEHSQLSSASPAYVRRHLSQTRMSDDGAIQGRTGDSVTVTCNPGYSGSGVAECGTDGSFSIVTCEANSCTSALVENSDRDSSNPITGRTGESGRHVQRRLRGKRGCGVRKRRNVLNCRVRPQRLYTDICRKLGHVKRRRRPRIHR